MSIRAFVIQHGKHKNKKTGVRRSGKIEWAQFGIQMLLSRNAVPEGIGDTALMKLVEDELRRDKEYLKTRYRLSRQTVMRAWRILHSADHYR